MIHFQNHKRKRVLAKLADRKLADSAPTQPPLTLFVLNLTSDSRQYVSNLDEAIASVNYQVKNHFQPQWGVTGTLVNKTADFNLHLTEVFGTNAPQELVGPDSPDFGKQIVDWIVNNEEGIDWSSTGIIYVTDPQTSFGGVHEDEKVSSLDIPFALVGAADQFWSVVLSHETLELLADPWGSRFVQYQSNQEITYVDQATGESVTANVPVQDWIVEVCDAVETNDDGYQISGVPVSNFIGQAYYNTTMSSNLDYRNLLKRGTDASWPFPINPGGYLSFWDANNPSDLYQIVWPGGQDQPNYTKLSLATGDKKKVHKQLELLSHSPTKSNFHHDHKYHRILKYLRHHKATCVSHSDQKQSHKRKQTSESSSSIALEPQVGKKQKKKESKTGGGTSNKKSTGKKKKG